jgi:hypothetical protein
LISKPRYVSVLVSATKYCSFHGFSFYLLLFLKLN